MTPVRGDAYAELEDPVDAAGNSVYSGKQLDCIGRLTAAFVFPGGLVDFMSTMTGQLLVSRRAANVIKDFRLQEGWQALECVVIDDDGRRIKDAMCFHFPRFMELVDEEKSEFRPIAQTRGRTIVRKVLKAALVEQHDLCKAAYVSGYVCSESLMQAMQTAKLIGFVFEELKVA